MYIIHLLQKYSDYCLMFILAVVVFLLFYTCGPSTDIWYHIKLGEVFLQKGIFFHDVFSFSAFGRPIVPYEWLFQVLIYLYQKLFGISALGIFVGFFSALQIAFFYILIRRIFSLHWVGASIISFFYIASISGFLIQRPTVVANLFFLILMFLIFLYLYKQKNFLWIGIPLMVFWTNFHASFVLGIGLTGIYTLVCWGKFLQERKDKTWRKKGIVFLIYTFIFFIISILPPLWGRQYFTFLQYAQYHNDLIQILEWRPLYAYNATVFWVYTSIAIFSTLLFFISLQRKLKDLILLFPIGMLIISPYIANRNILYGSFGIMILLVLTLLQKSRLVIHIGLISFICILYILFMKPFTYSVGGENYPVDAASFILAHHIQGNMLNDYRYGGYLLYRLYPEQKVFVDGRGDMYLCCEFPRLNTLAELDSQNNETLFLQKFEELLSYYHISFVLTTRSLDMNKRIIKILSEDPHWSLVFWNDSSQIFVKKDSPNTGIIKKFGVNVATPYGQGPYDSKKMNQAFVEYQRMVNTSDSAISRNVLGLIYIKKNNSSQASQEFKKAMQLQPDYLPPVINLAFLDIREKDYADTIPLFNKAIEIDPTNVQAYIYLAQIYTKIYQNNSQARDILNTGLQNVSDEKGREVLENMMNSLDSI